jgi:FkbM family methyltransferase
MRSRLRRRVANIQHGGTPSAQSEPGASPVAKSGEGLRRRFATSLVRGRPLVRSNLSALAALRDESVEETAEQIALNVLRTVPRSLDAYRLDFNLLEVAECGFEAGHPWLRTASGRIFYDYPATAKDGLMYALLRDRVPDELNPETFGVAANVIRRYLRGTANVPENARVAVDAGCYIGYKPLAYADLVGPEGKVVAIEMMPDNVEILRRNVEANQLTDRIATVNCALSDRVGTVTARRFRQQQATIADVDELDAKFGAECEVPMDTLANVFERCLGDRDVDFLNVQVNGNELAVLDGLGSWKHRVGSFSVTSPYSRGGTRLRDQVVEWFNDHRISVTDVAETSVRARNR